MSGETDRMLNQGLAAGYAKKGSREKLNRGPIPFKATEIPLDEGGRYYRDEFTAVRTGGGQEIVQVGNERATRLYGGGVVRPEILDVLALTIDDVIDKLRSFINNAKGKTRLSTVHTDSDGDWVYAYVITERFIDIPVVTATETISYKGRLVFAHPFIHTTIE